MDGYFSHIGGAVRDGFAALDAKTGKATPFRLAASNPIVAHRRLYVDVYHGQRHAISAAFDLPNLMRDKRWAPRAERIFAIDSRFAYTHFQTSASGKPDKEVLVALDPTTGAMRWRSPVFSPTSAYRLELRRWILTHLRAGRRQLPEHPRLTPNRQSPVPRPRGLPHEALSFARAAPRTCRRLRELRQRVANWWEGDSRLRVAPVCLCPVEARGASALRRSVLRRLF